MVDLNTPISLTPFERWTLIMQANAHLESATDDYQKAYLAATITCLEHGYEGYYQESLGHLSEPFPPAESRFVTDLLSFYRRLDLFLQENEEHREALEEGYWSKFRGFGGNEETDYFCFVKWLVDAKGLFSELKESETNLDAHGPTLYAYKPMVEEYRKRLKTEQLGLGLEDFEEILATTKSESQA